MNPIDRSLYSAMNTVELSLHINNDKAYRHDSELSKKIMSKMRHLKKNGRINKRVFKYFIDSLQPGKDGFPSRWVNRYARYAEIIMMTEKLANKSDREKIEFLFSEFAGKGCVTRIGISDKEEFSDKEAERVARYGFLGITHTQLENLGADGNLKKLLQISCRLPDRETIIYVMRRIQTYGFSLYQPETDVQPKKVGFLGLIK